MRDRHWRDLHVAYLEALTQTDLLEAQRWFTHTPVSARRHEDRQPVLSGKPFDSGDMVGMLVGYQNGVELPRADPQRGQALLSGTQAEAAVDQQPGLSGLDQCRIPATAAPE